jgi:hypothetical protein
VEAAACVVSSFVLVESPAAGAVLVLSELFPHAARLATMAPANYVAINFFANLFLIFILLLFGVSELIALVYHCEINFQYESDAEM